MVELRSKCEKNEMWAGIDAFSCKKEDVGKLNLYAPSVLEKRIKSANGVTIMILKIGDMTATSDVME